MKNRLIELAGLFIKMGFTAFGGPAAHIGMMEDEVVRKRKWMDDQHFLDLVGATNLIPGPNSTEMAIHCGHERGGIAGLFVAGLSFILPACLITVVLAFFYQQYGALPEVEPFLVGIKPAVLMIIVGAVLKLGKKAIQNRRLATIGLAAAAGGAAGGNTAFLILGLGLVGLAWFETTRRRSDKILSVEPVSLLLLFFVFFKIGALLFGSGYVLIAYFETELIDNLGILTRTELLDAIAVGQFTPGPLLSSATFVGYLIGGIPGAVVATLGMVLPSTLFVWILNPLVPRMRGSKIFGNFLNAVNAGAVGVMAGVAVLLGRQVLIDWRAWVVGALAALAVFGPKKISSVWVVAGGSLIGRLLLEIPF